MEEYRAIEGKNDKLKRILSEKGRPNLSQKIEVADKWIGLGYPARTVLHIVGV